MRCGVSIVDEPESRRSAQKSAPGVCPAAGEPVASHPLDRSPPTAKMTDHHDGYKSLLCWNLAA